MTSSTPHDQPLAGAQAVHPPADLAAALDLLDGVAIGPDPLDVRVAAASAAAHLRTARPPYAPPRTDLTGMPARTALPDALRHLTSALNHAGSVDEAMRIADAIDELDAHEPDAPFPGGLEVSAQGPELPDGEP